MDIVATNNAPQAIGPYSQAAVLGDWVFTSGQIALDPSRMEIVDGDVAAQTERVLQNVEAVLEAAGSNLGNVLKTTVYLTDMADFKAMNEVYARHFGDHKPARTTIQVAGLPMNARVEVDTIAQRA